MPYTTHIHLYDKSCLHALSVKYTHHTTPNTRNFQTCPASTAFFPATAVSWTYADSTVSQDHNRPHMPMTVRRLRRSIVCAPERLSVTASANKSSALGPHCSTQVTLAGNASQLTRSRSHHLFVQREEIHRLGPQRDVTTRMHIRTGGTVHFCYAG